MAIFRNQKFSNESFAQNGEDLILSFLFDLLQIKKPVYLDIGANHPVRLSNTYKFYKKGCRGVCVEPNPEFVKLFKQYRPEDKLIQAGINFTDGVKTTGKYYKMSWNEFNTFNEQQAKETEAAYAASGKVNKVEAVIELDLLPINDVIEENLGKSPDLLSIDVEGVDLEILKTLDFDRWEIAAICLETYQRRNWRENFKKASALLEPFGYEVFANTLINTIFVRTTFLDRAL